MRYPEDRIKAAILHPDIEIRDRAAGYFARAFSRDASLMPFIIEAVERYGRENDAFRLVGDARDLVQTAETVSWLINELNGEADRYESYAYNLALGLLHADPALLLPRKADILAARHFPTSMHEPLIDRLRMLDWDEATCWQKLEEFCEEGKEKQYTNEVDLPYAHLVVEALARFGPACEPRVQECLAVSMEDVTDHPMKWLEPLVVRLAGQARLESTVPAIIAKLQLDDGDVLNEECAEALTRIGTPAVLHAIAEAYPAAPQSFRIYAAGPLEHIHSDRAVEVVLKLFPEEKDRHLQRELAQALLGQFASEGIEMARQLLQGRKLDFQDRGLRHSLLETCTLTGERFPEYDAWLDIEKAEQVEHQRRIKELENDPDGLLRYALEKMMGKKAPPPPPVRPVPTRKPVVKEKVGRNAPCPCGSGKKFKHCCLQTGRRP